jgi:multiple sugar transport system ATP-binding protein
MSQVILENVYKSFAPRKGDASNNNKDAESPSDYKILRRINLTVNDGEFMVLVGPSGCGKSTLLRLIAGLETVSAGNIWVGDRVVNDLAPKQRDIAMVFQSYALYPHLNVYDNLGFGLRRAKREEGEKNKPSGKEGNLPEWWEDFLVGITRKLPQGLRYLSEKEKLVDERVRQVAKLLQIESFLFRLPKQLSGGQKQRVALGRAISRNPQVFLMDEPLSNLDAKLRQETRAQIVQLQRELGITTIYVTHDQVEAMTMGDRIAIMNQGQIQQVAKPLELYHYPANRFVAEFIGSPPMNFIPVKLTSSLSIIHPQFRITLPDSWAETLSYYEDKSLILGIRPEDLIMSPPATKNLPVQVEMIEALGHETLLSVSLVDNYSQKIQVRISPDRTVKIGDKIWLAIALDKVHFFDPDTGLAIFPNFI